MAIYEVAMPYASSWDLLDVIRSMPSVKSAPFVVTTPKKKELDEAVGKTTSTLEIAGQHADRRGLLKAVEKAAATTLSSRYVGYARDCPTASVLAGVPPSAQIRA